MSADKPSTLRVLLSAVIASILITGIPAVVLDRYANAPGSQGEISSSFSEQKLAKISLNVPGTVKATLYFGQLGSLIATVKDVKFNVPQNISENQLLCVETVIFSNVAGERGAVYAQGVSPTEWYGAEKAPDQDTKAQEGTLHQQLISPLLSGTSERHVRLSAYLRTGNETFNTQAIEAYGHLVNSGNEIWMLNNNTLVSCAY